MWFYLDINFQSSFHSWVVKCYGCIVESTGKKRVSHSIELRPLLCFDSGNVCWRFSMLATFIYPKAPKIFQLWKTETNWAGQGLTRFTHPGLFFTASSKTNWARCAPQGLPNCSYHGLLEYHWSSRYWIEEHETKEIENEDFDEACTLCQSCDRDVCVFFLLVSRTRKLRLI